jgi:hypothetical protein
MNYILKKNYKNLCGHLSHSIWSRIFQSCILVRHFQVLRFLVLYFQRPPSPIMIINNVKKRVSFLGTDTE